jgi:hypothetical protein
MASNAALAQREPEQRAESAAPTAAAGTARVCPIHGPLDPTWTRCPYCLKEGREGRLLSGAVNRDAVPGADAAAASPPAPAAPDFSIR